MSTQTDYGPLTQWISEQKQGTSAPELKKEERPLPCEDEQQACSLPGPVLSPEVFSLSVLWKHRRRVPRFGLYDPNSRDSACWFYPHGAILGGHVSVDTRLASRIDWIGVQVMSCIFGGVGLIMGIICPIPSMEFPRPGLVPLFWLVALAGAVGVWLSRGQDSILVSTFSGPIPPAIRAKIRQLDHPLIIAPAQWEVDRSPLYLDPYVVKACIAGGQPHFHVHARWDISKGEVLVEEFMGPAEVGTSEKRAE
jgi:hypothetical protein